MKRFFAACTALALALLLVLPVLAQGTVQIEVEPGIDVDRQALERAANNLASRGAEVVVYLVNRGEGDEFTRRLEQDGYTQGNLTVSSLIAIFVSFDDRYSEIAYGDSWNEALATNDNVDFIRESFLNSNLAEGATTTAIVETLNAIGESIDNPPTPGGGTQVDVDLLPIAVGGTAVAAIAVGGPALLAARRRQRRLAELRTKTQEAREGAGVAIADLAQLLRTVEEKAQFDQVSYPSARVEQLAQLMQRGREEFSAAQVAFDDVGERLARKQQNTREELQAAINAYNQVTQQIQSARQPLEESERLRAELDQLNAQAPGELERLKKS